MTHLVGLDYHTSSLDNNQESNLAFAAPDAASTSGNAQALNIATAAPDTVHSTENGQASKA
jgi:hypothetical protein